MPRSKGISYVVAGASAADLVKAMHLLGELSEFADWCSKADAISTSLLPVLEQHRRNSLYANDKDVWFARADGVGKAYRIST